MHFTVCDYVLDLVHNSIQAGAQTVRVDIEETPGRVVLEVADDGVGMNDAQVQRATDPFYTDGIKHPDRRVGLGLPFLVQAIDAVDGTLRLESVPGAGTTVRAEFNPQHVDAPPVGDVTECLCACFGFDGGYELIVRRLCADRSYRIRRSELREALGDLNETESRFLLRRYLASQEAETCE